MDADSKVWMNVCGARLCYGMLYYVMLMAWSKIRYSIYPNEYIN